MILDDNFKRPLTSLGGGVYESDGTLVATCPNHDSARLVATLLNQHARLATEYLNSGLMASQRRKEIARAIAAELAMDSAHIPMIQAIIEKHLGLSKSETDPR